MLGVLVQSVPDQPHHSQDVDHTDNDVVHSVTHRAIVSVMFSLLLFVILLIFWVYVLLEPLTLLWARFCLWLGNTVVSKRDHKTHIHAWAPDAVTKGANEVCVICGKLRETWEL